MDRKEFMEKLQRALAGGLNSSMVADNMRYYQEYIDTEIRKGRSEKEVLESLGDPRLLAKSIIEANKRAGASYGSNREYDEEMSSAGTEDRSRYGSGYENAASGRRWVLPGWLLMIIITVVVLLFIGLATSLLYLFSPVIIAVLIVILIVKLFQSNTK